jgi:hypothetical protein|tara:strand:- start:348 stop:689 length:342 start_codon:yes stop_codon:yes gene_type:complete
MNEQRQQEALVTYIQLQYKGTRYCASLGGQYQRYQSQRNKAIRTGYIKGFPDLQICEARKTYHGLFIELKTKTGRITKEQQQWLDDLNERGYYAICCKGLESAMEIIDWYLKE